MRFVCQAGMNGKNKMGSSDDDPINCLLYLENLNFYFVFDCFPDEYPSAYHPPPFNSKVHAEIIFFAF